MARICYGDWERSERLNVEIGEGGGGASGWGVKAVVAGSWAQSERSGRRDQVSRGLKGVSRR